MSDQRGVMKPEPSPELVSKKKPYQPPKLLVYGKLTELTQTKGRNGNRDGGVGLRRFTG